MAGIQQQESTPIVGAISGSGNATVTITKAGMTGTPLAVTVAVLIGDSTTVSAGKMVAALNANANFAAVCWAYNSGATLWAMVKTAAANDATMNIAYTNDTCTGLTPDAISDHSIYGTTSTPTNAYCTLAEAKARLWPTEAPAYATEDGALIDLINYASREIDDNAGRRFYVNTVDETRYYEAENYYRIYTDDIVSVTSLKTDLDLDRVYETTWLTTDYDLMPSNASVIDEPYTYIQVAPVRSVGNFFPLQAKGIQIIGKFGWPSVPEQIREACLIKVQIEYWMKNGMGGTTPKQTIDTLETKYQYIISQLAKNWVG